MNTRLLSTRLGALIIALLLAGSAAAAVLLYTHQYRAGVDSQSGQVTVLVANQTIHEFTPGNQVIDGNMFRQESVSRRSLADGAITDANQLKGLVARSDIFPGAQLSLNQFAKSATTSPAVKLQPGQRAMGFQLDAASGLIGQVQAGDHVDVLATFDVLPVGKNGLPLTGAVAIPVTRIIASDVLVISAPPTAVSGGSDSSASQRSSVITLAIPDSDAAPVAFAQQKGQLNFALRAPGSSDDLPTGVTDMGSVLRGTPTTAGLVPRLLGRG